MGVNYGWEKFFISLRIAVGSEASLQDRLATVISGVTGLRHDDFPSDGEIWSRFRDLIETTTKLPALHKEGTIQATTSQMTNDEAAKLLREALGIFSDVAIAYGKSW